MNFTFFYIKAGNCTYWQDLLVRAKNRQAAIYAFRAHLAAANNQAHEVELFGWKIQDVNDQNAELLEETERPLRPVLVAEREKWTYTFLDNHVEGRDTPEWVTDSLDSAEDGYPLGHVEMIGSGENG